MAFPVYFIAAVGFGLNAVAYLAAGTIQPFHVMSAIGTFLLVLGYTLLMIPKVGGMFAGGGNHQREEDPDAKAHKKQKHGKLQIVAYSSLLTFFLLAAFVPGTTPRFQYYDVLAIFGLASMCVLQVFASLVLSVVGVALLISYYVLGAIQKFRHPSNPLWIARAQLIARSLLSIYYGTSLYTVVTNRVSL